MCVCRCMWGAPWIHQYRGSSHWQRPLSWWGQDTCWVWWVKRVVSWVEVEVQGHSGLTRVLRVGQWSAVAWGLPEMIDVHSQLPQEHQNLRGVLLSEPTEWKTPIILHLVLESSIFLIWSWSHPFFSSCPVLVFRTVVSCVGGIWYTYKCLSKRNLETFLSVGNNYFPSVCCIHFHLNTQDNAAEWAKKTMWYHYTGQWQKYLCRCCHEV